MRQPPTMHDAVFLDGNLWFSAREFNGLCRYNVAENTVYWVGLFPDVEAELSTSHRRCFLEGNRIFFIPYSAHKIHIYDIKKNNFRVISFNEAVTESCMIEKKIYIFCLIKGNYLYELDTVTCEVRLIQDFTVQMDSTLKTRGGYNILRCFAERNQIWFGLNGTSLVGCWDVNLRKLNIINTGVSNVFCARWFDNDLWIIDGNSENIMRMEELRTLKRYDGSPNTYNREYPNFRCFNNILEYNGSLIFVPGFSDTVAVWDKREMNWYSFPLRPRRQEMPVFIQSVEMEEALLILPFESEFLLCVEKNGAVSLKDPMKLSKDFLRDKLSDTLHTNKVINENQYNSFGIFLEYI